MEFLDLPNDCRFGFLSLTKAVIDDGVYPNLFDLSEASRAIDILRNFGNLIERIIFKKDEFPRSLVRAVHKQLLKYCSGGTLRYLSIGSYQDVYPHFDYTPIFKHLEKFGIATNKDSTTSYTYPLDVCDRLEDLFILVPDEKFVKYCLSLQFPSLKNITICVNEYGYSIPYQLFWGFLEMHPRLKKNVSSKYEPRNIGSGWTIAVEISRHKHPRQT